MLNILVSLSSLLILNFHSLSFQDVDGNTISLSNYQNKKVLLVNIATNSNKISQLSGLQQLQEQYRDSLVVIVFPSNSFGNESRTNEQIKGFCQSNYNATFVIAGKSPVIGNSINSVFSWLANKSSNGEMDAPAGGDFQKFLVNKDGMLVGVFSPKVAPSDSALVEGITTSF